MAAEGVNMDDFMKWRQNQTVLVESDMEDIVKNEAKEIVTTGIEKSNVGGAL